MEIVGGAEALDDGDDQESPPELIDETPILS